MGRVRWWWREENGAEALEMALALPIYLLTLFSTMTFILVLFGYGSATMAAKMGVRYAIVHSSTALVPCSATSIQTMVNSMLMAPMASSTSVVSGWSAGNTIGSTVTVSVTLTYGVLPFNFLNNFAPTITAKAVVVH